MANEGSPPRMRGKVDKHDPKRGQHRITPAYAGKSLALDFRLNGFGDHPRVCGEKASHAGSGVRMVGSPPRLRGKV